MTLRQRDSAGFCHVAQSPDTSLRHHDRVSWIPGEHQSASRTAAAYLYATPLKQRATPLKERARRRDARLGGGRRWRRRRQTPTWERSSEPRSRWMSAVASLQEAILTASEKFLILPEN